MRRGDVVIISSPGDYGKPRPAIVVQGELSSDLASRVVRLVTSHIVDGAPLRVHVEPTPSNGLRRASQVQADKITTFPTTKIGASIGSLTDIQMNEIDGLLLSLLGLTRLD